MNIFEAREDCNSTLIERPGKPLARYISAEDGWRSALPRRSVEEEAAMETAVLSDIDWNAACVQRAVSLAALDVVSTRLPILPLDLAAALGGSDLAADISSALGASSSAQAITYRSKWDGRCLTVPVELEGRVALIGHLRFTFEGEWELQVTETAASLKMAG